MKGKDEKILWIDCIKAIAILAVLVDHTFMVLYDNPNIQTATFFSVSLFILVMGITTWISEENHSKEEVGTRVRRRIKKIIIPYIVATFIYSVFQDRYFNFELFINRVVLFNASGPLYYVALYIQLIVINIFMYTIIKKCNQCKYSCLYKTIIFIFLLFGASLSINYSNILNIYGGGGKLFGGTYAVLSYLGMILAPWMLGEKGKLYLVNLSGVSSILWALWMGFIWKDHFHIDTYFPLGGGGINPPGVTLFVLAVLMLLFLYSFFLLLSRGNNKYGLKFAKSVGNIGKNSLYIFLYHKLILDYFLNIYVHINNVWIKRLIFLLCMIGIPIVGEKLYMLIKCKLYSAE